MLMLIYLLAPGAKANPATLPSPASLSGPSLSTLRPYKCRVCGNSFKEERSIVIHIGSSMNSIQVPSLRRGSLITQAIQQALKKKASKGNASTAS
jgi:hypothetical protein